MSEIWEKLDGWIAKNAPETFSALNPPASEAAISAAEAAIHLTFPPSLRTLFLAHDGETEDSAGLFAWWRLLPLSEVVETWEEFLLTEQQSEAGALGDGAFVAERSIPVMWCEGEIRYIEIADGMLEGPLLELSRHGPPKLIAPSLAHFLNNQFTMLTDGRLVVEEDFGFNLVPVGASASGM